MNIHLILQEPGGAWEGDLVNMDLLYAVFWVYRPTDHYL